MKESGLKMERRERGRQIDRQTDRSRGNGGKLGYLDVHYANSIAVFVLVLVVFGSDMVE